MSLVSLENENVTLTNVQSFDLSKIKRGDRIYVVGSREVGKTTIILNILENFNMDPEKDTLIVYTPILPEHSHWSKYTPNIFNKLYTSDIDDIFNIDKTGRMVLVIDDHMLKGVNPLKLLILKSVKISIIVVAQCHRNPLVSLYDYDWCILCRNDSEMQRLCSFYGNVVNNFKQIYNSVTSVKYRHLVIDKTNNGAYALDTRLNRLPAFLGIKYQPVPETKTNLTSIRDELNSHITALIELRGKLDKLIQ